MQRLNSLLIHTFFLLLVVSTSYSQGIKMWCGTSTDDQKAIMDEFVEHRDEIFQNTIRNGAVIYIPVKFHLIGDNNADDQVTPTHIYRQFCKINQDFEPYDIQFYMQGGIIQALKYINDTRIHDDPNSPVSTNLLRNYQQGNSDAINIFVNNVVQKDDPGVLGRFYRNNDYIIIANGEVISAKSSLSHEIGHFLGLSHTFYGWEATEYECTRPTPMTVFLGNFPVPVEYVSRTKNCFSAADKLCDTPADYNLGLGYQGPCDYTGCAKDPDGVDLVPQTENMMGYFLNCLSVFSPQQVSIMLSNYNSLQRSYLRLGYIPSLIEITDKPELLSPEDRSVTPYFDEVDLEWSDVAGAQGYIVSVDLAPNFSTGVFEAITMDTRLTVSG
ncbi:MAG: M43 family zinc metalloprotease, partial [Saprospiraceae bacterium]|nr:M43 family zinc metalloprotease [Saprospiraceae bacterium]